MKQKTLPVYTIEDFTIHDQEEHFYANDIASHLKRTHFIRKPHKHDFYIVILCTKGSGTHQIDFNTYNVVPGSVFTIAPGQAHTWEVSDDIQGYTFFHSEEFYNLYFTSEKIKNYPFFCSIQNVPMMVLKNNSKEKIESLFKEIVAEYENNQLMKFQKLRSQLDTFYIELSRLYLPKKIIINQNHSYLKKLRILEDLIAKHFKTIKSPKQYAELMHLSEKHLNRICKESLNKTTTDVIADRIMLEAKRMLVNGKYSVTETADELGYLDHSYFSRIFKKKSGQTPLEFVNAYSQSSRW